MDPGVFARLEKQMPDLLSAMRKDLLECPCGREFEVSEGAGLYAYETNAFEYYENVLPSLRGKVRILLNHRLIEDISHGHTRRYVIGEELAGYLTAGLDVTVVAQLEAAIAREQPSNLVPENNVPTTIGSAAAVQAVLKYIRAKGLDTTQFANQAQTTDRTIRRFLKRGLVRRSTFDLMAAGMGLSREELLRGELPKEPQ
jgi:hypothetical protein